MISDDELDQMCDVITEHEGCIPWLYCDNRGFVTVGVGHLVKSEDSVAPLPFLHRANGSHATDEEKRASFEKVKKAYREGLAASAYAGVTDLRLDLAFVRRLLAARVKGEFVPAVEANCPTFEEFPLPVKLALVDIAYNVGAAGFAKFDPLIGDCNAGRFDKAADHCHTKKTGEDPKDPKTWGRRNTWRRDQFLQAADAAEGTT